jgi:SAM-dependent methyltransferase
MTRPPSVVERIHGNFVYARRVETLANLLAPLIPANSSLLDIGCGDGLLSSLIQSRVSGSSIEGIDTLVRDDVRIRVFGFDGVRVPYPDGSFDGVLFVDVLHHTADPFVLLREATRVARRFILIKDHLREGFLAQQTLDFMDRVGNERHGVAVAANYWRERQWRDAFRGLGLRVASWRTDLALYPWWASWLFGRRLHMIAKVQASD